MEDQDNRRWFEAADQAQAEAFARLARSASHGMAEKLEHGVLFSTGIPSRTFNGLSLTKLQADSDETIASARKFADRVGLPCSLQLRQELLDSMKSAISSAGLKEFDSEPGMILSLDTGPHPTPKGLLLKSVVEPVDIGTCFRTLAAGYQIPVWVLRPFLDKKVLQAYSMDPALNFHLGYSEGRPVASSIGLVSGPVSYVFMVGVVPAHRRRGYGEALTWRTAYAGKDSGCRVSYLRATDMGRPVYEKMGYREVTRYHSFSLNHVRGWKRARLVLRVFGWIVRSKL